MEAGDGCTAALPSNAYTGRVIMANITESWRGYQPNKGTLVWSFLGGIAATLIVGFAVFNWHTAGGAESLARTAAEDAQAELASDIWIARFKQAPHEADRLKDREHGGAEKRWRGRV